VTHVAHDHLAGITGAIDEDTLRFARTSDPPDHVPEAQRVLIYGAGDAGEMIVRDMRHNPFYGYEPIGFFDDDRASGATHPRRQGSGWPGGDRRIIAERRPDAVVIAIPRADASTVRSIVQARKATRSRSRPSRTFAIFWTVR